MTTREELLDLYSKFRRAIITSLLDKQKAGIEKFPSDKSILHALITVAYTMAQEAKYPFENVLISHLTTIIQDREKCLKLVNEFYDRDQSIRNNSNKLLS